MINLLPYKEKRSIEKIRTIRLVATSIVGAILIIIIAGVLLMPTLLTINSRYSITTKQIADLQKNSSITSDVDLASFEKQVSSVSSKLASPAVVQPTEYFDTIKSLVPSGVIVSQFATTDTTHVNVSGVADTREVLQSFIKALENSDKIASVDSPVSNFIKNKNSGFILTISFK